MDGATLVSLIRNLGGKFTLYPNGSGFRVQVPRKELVPLLEEAVRGCSEILPILREEEPSAAELALAFDSLPSEDRRAFTEFGQPNLESFASYAHHAAKRLIESATGVRKANARHVRNAR